MTMQDLNPLRAIHKAWDEVAAEFDDVPEDEIPEDFRRARESVDAICELKASMQAVGAERRRLKSKAQ
jgi:hypothetical protein